MKTNVMLLLCWATSMGAATITGTVTDDHTGKKLAGVSVEIKGGSASDTTDTDGFFELDGGTVSVPVVFNPQSLVRDHGELTVYRNNGAVVTTVDRSGYEALRRLTAGMYVARLQQDRHTDVFKMLVTGTGVAGPGLPVSTTSAKAAITAAGGSDTLTFSKAGYRPCETVASFGDTALSIAMTVNDSGFPGAHNTGYTGILDSSAGLTITEDGAVIENLVTGGTVTVQANDVTIRNCKIRKIMKAASNSAVNLLVEDCEVGWIGEADFTLRRCSMRSVADDLIRVAGPNVLIEDCFLLMTGPDNPNAHQDAIQEYPTGSSNGTAVIRHNTILNTEAKTSCINGPSGALVENNLMAGGGFTIYGAKSMSLIDNRFSTRYFSRSGRWGLIYRKYGETWEPPVFTGNVWHETGEPASPLE